MLLVCRSAHSFIVCADAGCRLNPSIPPASAAALAFATRARRVGRTPLPSHFPSPPSSLPLLLPLLSASGAGAGTTPTLTSPTSSGGSGASSSSAPPPAPAPAPAAYGAGHARGRSGTHDGRCGCGAVSDSGCGCGDSGFVGGAGASRRRPGNRSGTGIAISTATRTRGCSSARAVVVVVVAAVVVVMLGGASAAAEPAADVSPDAGVDAVDTAEGADAGLEDVPVGGMYDAAKGCAGQKTKREDVGSTSGADEERESEGGGQGCEERRWTAQTKGTHHNRIPRPLVPLLALLLHRTLPGTRARGREPRLPQARLASQVDARARRGGDPGAVCDGLGDHAAVAAAEEERADDDCGGNAEEEDERGEEGVDCGAEEKGAARDARRAAIRAARWRSARTGTRNMDARYSCAEDCRPGWPPWAPPVSEGGGGCVGNAGGVKVCGSTKELVDEGEEAGEEEAGEEEAEELKLEVDMAGASWVLRSGGRRVKAWWQARVLVNREEARLQSMLRAAAAAGRGRGLTRAVVRAKGKNHVIVSLVECQSKAAWCNALQCAQNVLVRIEVLPSCLGLASDHETELQSGHIHVQSLQLAKVNLTSSGWCTGTSAVTSKLGSMVEYAE
ncbi:hypothetical protein GGX14DRAFT_395338 [Mycena pura]|uniref:Uncharacterized protein n=1 Tax=Mycena pura TaxID=153505 RepID=A0AAD6VK21_9AGAR|nr:hypothetical protein GGX14DRAFT_395338 [Mycena pura]